MTQPLVSVVLPAKDMENFIHDALSSLLIQGLSREELEVVVVDDGSTDMTALVVEGFREAIPHLTILRNKTPQGVSAARNQGMRAATGLAITFLDPDDWFGPGHLRDAARDLVELEVDFVRTDHTRQTGRRRELMRTPEARYRTRLHPLDGVCDPETSTMLDYPLTGAGLYRLSLRDTGQLHFDETCATAEDREFMWRLHTTCTSYAVLAHPGFFYRRGVTGSLTSEVTSRQLGFIDAFGLILRDIATLELTTDARELAVTQAHLEVKAARQFLAIANFQAVRFIDALVDADTHNQSDEANRLTALVLELAHRTHRFTITQPQVGRSLERLDLPRAKRLDRLFSVADTREISPHTLVRKLTHGDA